MNNYIYLLLLLVLAGGCGLGTSNSSLEVEGTNLIEFESSNGYMVKASEPNTSVAEFLESVETDLSPTAVTFQWQQATPGGRAPGGKSMWQFVAVLEVPPSELETLTPQIFGNNTPVPPLSDFQLVTWLPESVRQSFIPRGDGFKVDPEVSVGKLNNTTSVFSHSDYTTGWYFIAADNTIYLHFESS